MSSAKFVRHRQLSKEHLSRKELFDYHECDAHSRQSVWNWNTYMKKKSKKERIFAWAMMVLVLVESVFLFLQAGKGFHTKSTEDIDLAAFILLLISNIMWLLYGFFVLQDLPVILSGFLYTIGSILVIVTIVLYGGNKSSQKLVNEARLQGKLAE